MRLDRPSRKTALVLLLVLASPSAVAAPPAPAAPGSPAGPQAKPKTLTQTLQGQAKADFEGAKLLVNDGDFAAAFFKFQAAYDASKDPRLLWNMAACQKNLRKYSRAIELLKKYAGDPSALVTTQDRQEANDLIKTLEPFTASVTIQSPEAGVDVSIDDVAIGKTPLPGPITLDLGDHTIRAHKDGFRDLSFARAISGAQSRIDLVLTSDVRESKLVVVAPEGSTIEIDGAPIGQAQGVQGLSRVVAPGRHVVRALFTNKLPVTREVLVAEGETRTLELSIAEVAPPPQLAELRLAIGCADADVRGPEEGLAVYLDGSPAAVPPSHGKRKLAQGGDQSSVEFVGYRVQPGVHRIIVRTTDCKALETQVDVPITGAEIRGTLESKESSILRGPAGIMGWGRLSLALWLPSEFDERSSDAVTTTNGQLARVLQSSPRYKPSGVGILFSPAIVSRWSEVGLDLGYAGGSVKASGGDSAVPLATNLNADGNLTHLRAGVHFGPRIPFHYVAVGIPLGLSYDLIDVKNLPNGLAWQARNAATSSAGLRVEGYPLCDLAGFVSYGFEAGFAENAGVFVGQSVSFGVMWQPNPRCRAERANPVGLGLVQLNGSGAAPQPPAAPASGAVPASPPPATSPAPSAAPPPVAPPPLGPTTLPPGPTAPLAPRPAPPAPGPTSLPPPSPR